MKYTKNVDLTLARKNVGAPAFGRLHSAGALQKAANYVYSLISCMVQTLACFSVWRLFADRFAIPLNNVQHRSVKRTRIL